MIEKIAIVNCRSTSLASGLKRLKTEFNQKRSIRSYFDDGIKIKKTIYIPFDKTIFPLNYCFSLYTKQIYDNVVN